MRAPVRVLATSLAILGALCRTWVSANWKVASSVIEAPIPANAVPSGNVGSIPDPSRAGVGTVIHTEIVRRPTILTFLVSVFWQDSHLELTVVADADVHVGVLDRLRDHRIDNASKDIVGRVTVCVVLVSVWICDRSKESSKDCASIHSWSVILVLVFVLVPSVSVWVEDVAQVEAELTLRKSQGGGKEDGTPHVRKGKDLFWALDLSPGAPFYVLRQGSLFLRLSLVEVNQAIK